jgi:signal transduction histidine kinase
MVLTVGLALLLAAVLARGSRSSRALIGAAGAAWLATSSVPAVVLVHQAVLLVLVLGCPRGLPRGRVSWALTAAAVPVALLLVPQPVVAALFAAAAMAALPELRADPVGRIFPVVAGLSLATVLGAGWAVSRLAPFSFDPALALRAYELVLLALAVGFVVASRALVTHRAGLADRLLREDRPVDLGGLAALLAEVLDDPQLRITPGDQARQGDPQARFEVRERDRLLAVVEHSSPAMEDESVATAVTAAVRLVALNLERRRELQARTDSLRQARDRVLAAADRQRATTAALLRADVVEPLFRTATTLRSGGALPGDPRLIEAVEVAVQELDAAVEEMRDLVVGVPPASFGGGGLRAAVDALAARSPVPVQVSGGLSADPAVEAALFYVCSEALVNAGKHARARSVAVQLHEDERSLGVSVVDDGAGGADPTGSGLLGLADRMLAHGGRLQVESPPGAGTTVTASVPRQPIFR